jgi:hypothetical protein
MHFEEEDLLSSKVASAKTFGIARLYFTLPFTDGTRRRPA